MLDDLDGGTDALLSCRHQVWTNSYHEIDVARGGTDMIDELDVIADLIAEDDDGLGCSTLAGARDATRVRPGAMLLVGNESAAAVVRVWRWTTTVKFTSRSFPARLRRTGTSSATTTA